MPIINTTSSKLKHSQQLNMPLYRTRENLFEQLVDSELEAGTPSENNTDCSICLEAWQQHGTATQDVVRVKNCKHDFHRECLMNWICSDDQDLARQVNTTCPYCRTDIFKYVEPSQADRIAALDAREQAQDAHEHRFERHTRLLGFHVISAMYYPTVNGRMGTPRGIDAMIDYVVDRWRVQEQARDHPWANVPLEPIDMSETAVRYVVLLHLGWSMPPWRDVDPRIGEEYFQIARDRHVEDFTREGRDHGFSLVTAFHSSGPQTWTDDELAMFREAPRYLNGDGAQY